MQKKFSWKLPGGYSEEGEDLAESAIREVFEETGIKTEFISVICFRHRHDAPFNKGDFYFAIKLKPLSTEIKIDPNEIQECQWMKITDYLKSENVFPLNREIVKIATSNTYIQGSPIPSYNGKSTHTLYFSSLSSQN